MTLDQFIESLTQLRDHYNAGDFTVMTQEIDCETDNGEIMHIRKRPCMIDGDDYFLDLGCNQVRIMTKGNIDEQI